MFDITLIHPIVNHFTIALFLTSVVFDLIGMKTGSEKWRFAAWVNLLFAGGATILTVISGALAASNVPHGGNVHELMETHETLGYIVLTAVLALLAWRIALKGNFPVKAASVYIIVSVAGIGGMLTGAYYGGEMVFVHGVAVQAMPVEEHDTGHHHGEDDLHGQADDHEDSIKESAEKDQNSASGTEIDSSEKKQKIHVHKDGKQHLH